MVKLPANGWSRFWMTGCTALVLLAAGDAQPPADEGSSRRQAVTLASGYPVDETLERIVRQARHQGLAVVARLDAPSDAAAGRRVLVLGGAAPRTPGLHGQPAHAPAPPARGGQAPPGDGRAEVAVDDAAYWQQQPVVPGEVVARVAALPTLIESALRG